MTRGRKYKFLVVIPIASTLISGAITFISPKASAANAGDVVINEIMYNPSSGLDNDDYLELYNTTNDSINLDGWCFTAGITLCFTSSHTIAAHSYAVISRDTTQTETTYGVTPLALYTGNLSNGGEAITLQDASLNVIDTVTYSDSAPWPGAPDGNGPSLELKDPSLDNADPANWAASMGSPTPGAVNSVSGLDLPTITDVSDPNDVAADSPVTVTATIEGEQSVNLIYKVMFGAEVTVPMFDDGAHDDGVANNQVFGAQIPAQPAGQLVRFRIDATNTDGTASKPSNDDGINYYGYAVQNPAATSNAPILQWFIDDDDYNTMYAPGGENTTTRYPCVLVYGNDVYDNAEVRLKGNNTLYMPKKSFKFYLPSGYTIRLAGAERSVDEFHFNADFTSQNIAKVPAIWWVAKQAGIPTPDVITTRLQRNGQFEGTYNFIDKYESQWRRDTGFNQGELFEDSADIVSGADNLNSLTDWRTNMLKDSRTAEGRDYMLDTVNIPAMLNVMAFLPLTHHHDQTANHNTLQYRSNETQRWSILPWDFDLALVDPQTQKTLVGAYDQYPGQYGERWYMNPLYDQPDLRQAYLRRLRTLADTVYGSSDGFREKYLELTNRYAADIALDLEKWSSEGRRPAEADLAMIERQRLSILVHLRQAWGVPAAQTNAERNLVRIADVHTDINSANEYIRLENDSIAAVDLSDWEVEGINYTLPKGSVIPGGSSMYLLKDDLGYRALHSSVLVAGQYSQGLGFSGTLRLKTATGQVIGNSYVYN